MSEHHTRDELYEHRHALFLCLCRSNPDLAWRSKLHDDGSSFDGWFIAGIHTPAGDISYHLPLAWWERFDGITTLERAPEWDGYDSFEVIDRLIAWGCVEWL